MYNDTREIEAIVNKFVEDNKLDKNTFEVSSISRATGGVSKRVINTSKVKNKSCRYVIKYYINLHLFIIWNYSKCKNMSYSIKTIEKSLEVGQRNAPKGVGNMSNDRYSVYFENEKNLLILLNTIINNIS